MKKKRPIRRFAGKPYRKAKQTYRTKRTATKAAAAHRRQGTGQHARVVKEKKGYALFKNPCGGKVAGGHSRWAAYWASPKGRAKKAASKRRQASLGLKPRKRGTSKRGLKIPKMSRKELGGWSKALGRD